ncbi:hypothetical protein [Hyphomonas pacifica]|uniref:hypothetical protein n=1 Tax=Hyphomonas pacifica TaxID=1280941 RepID=UPI000DBFD6EB|nr:hypothetical protein [Hyphomonas pacifica]RAN37587.1 hypothetical protein HY11_08860 [Hyphomonas pacifica]
MITQINEKLNCAWSKLALNEPNILVPKYFGPLNKNTITFVGFNPSFVEGRTKEFFRTKGFELNSIREHYLWTNRNEFQRAVDDEFSVHSRNEYAFFAQHRELATFLGRTNWDHIDLFQFRETSQDHGLELLARNGEFRSEQLEMFERVLEIASPKMIVVANAKASDILKDRWQLGAVDAASGCHFHTVLNRPVPVFFSGMLTGRRALDVHSRERLFWNIRRVLESII